MPILFVLVLLLFAMMILVNKQKHGWMKNRAVDYLAFALSITSFCVSIITIRNVGVFADSFGSGVNIIFGGWFWLVAHWVAITLMFVVSLLTLMRLTKKSDLADGTTLMADDANIEKH